MHSFIILSSKKSYDVFVENITNTQNHFDDEISLLDIYNFLKRNFKWILISSIGSSIIAYTYALSVTPIYESEIRFEMAKVANSSVEDPKTLLSKLKSPTYYSLKTIDNCATNEEKETVDFRNGLIKKFNPTLDRDAPILSIEFKSASNSKNEICLNSVLNDIKLKQAELANTIIKQKKNQLETLEAKLILAEKYKNQFASKINYDFNDTKFSATSLLSALIVSKDSEIKDLQNGINDLKIALSEPQTRETFLSVPLISDQEPSYPKKRIFIILGFVVGGFLSLLFLLTLEQDKPIAK